MGGDRSSRELENEVAVKQFKKRTADVHGQDVKITGEAARVVLKSKLDPSEVVNRCLQEQEAGSHTHLVLPFKSAALVADWGEDRLEIWRFGERGEEGPEPATETPDHS